MGVAATFIARLLERHRWIAWLGLLLILYVSLTMISAGAPEVAEHVPDAYFYLLLPLGYLALPGVFPPWIWAVATLLQTIVISAIAATVTNAMRRNKPHKLTV